MPYRIVCWWKKSPRMPLTDSMSHDQFTHGIYVLWYDTLIVIVHIESFSSIFLPR